MGGRGTFASGNNVAYTYKTVGKINGVKVLKGIGGKHSLPEESHTSNVYIKLKPDGSFHEMRIYQNKNMSSTRNILRGCQNIDRRKCE